MPPEVEGIQAGQPVSASRSMNGTGRYLEFFYAASEGRINYVAANSPDQHYFQNLAAEYEVPPQPEALSKVDKWTIGGTIAGIAAVVVAVLAWLFGTDNGKQCRGRINSCLRRRDKRVVTETSSSE